MEVFGMKRVFERKGLAGTILVTSFTNVSVLLLTILISILTARIFGVEGRGELSAILFWPITLSGLIGFGLPTSLIYHVKRDIEHAAQYFKYSLFSLLPVSILVGGSLGTTYLHGWEITLIPLFNWHDCIQ